MYQAIRRTLIGAGLMLLSGVALVQAQKYGYPPSGYDPNYRGPDYAQPNANWGERLYDRVQFDLNRAAYDMYGSRRHVDHARKEVSDVQRQLYKGRFDRDEMGEAIGAIQSMLDHDALPEADRSILWRDLEQMRRFRDAGYGWQGYR